MPYFHFPLQCAYSPWCVNKSPHATRYLQAAILVNTAAFGAITFERQNGRFVTLMRSFSQYSAILFIILSFYLDIIMRSAIFGHRVRGKFVGSDCLMHVETARYAASYADLVCKTWLKNNKSAYIANCAILRRAGNFPPLPLSLSLTPFSFRSQAQAQA